MKQLSQTRTALLLSHAQIIIATMVAPPLTSPPAAISTPIPGATHEPQTGPGWWAVVPLRREEEEEEEKQEGGAGVGVLGGE
jgi:hypothetical protein